MTSISRKRTWIVALCTGLVLTGLWLGSLRVVPSSAAEPGLLVTGPPISTPTSIPTPTATPTSTPKVYEVHIPAVQYTNPAIHFDSVWTSDEQGNTKQAFLPGAAIRYHASGSNDSAEALQVQLATSHSNSCGNSQVISETLNLASGAWNREQPAVLPDCIGVYTYTLQMTHQQRVITQTTRFVVNNPSALATSDKPGFDICHVPSIETMKTWWDSSPYYSANIYLGGISLGCDNPDLDPFWVHEASQQGWSLIPTWVGPQAPCTTFRHRINPDPKVAYQQGKAEADAASLAAASLGLGQGRVIYYDVEGYYGASQSCRDTVKTFVQGWVDRLHALGAQAGVYGSCISYISDWATLNPIPDNVWMAQWNKKTYDPTATVWGVPCVSDDLWANHQRIRQYTGDHIETWGGVSLGIDSDTLDGAVTYLPQPAPITITLSAKTPQSSLSSQLEVQAMGLVSPQQGWTLVDGSLYWTEDSGLSWKDLTPETASQPLAAFFLDERQGWLLAQMTGAEGMSLLRSRDGGQTWEAFSLSESRIQSGAFIQSAYLDFIDADHGWVALRLPTSSGFNLGLLFATQDGGRTWSQEQIPFAAPISFVDALHGWVAGGLNGDELYRTSDGGRTWEREILPLPVGMEGKALVGLPKFEGGTKGYLPVVLDGAQGAQLALFTSPDGGDAWSLFSTITLPENIPATMPPLLSLFQGQVWVLSQPGQGGLYFLASDGAASGKLEAIPDPAILGPSMPSSTPLAGVIALEFATSQNGWAQVSYGICSGVKIPLGSGGSPSEDTFRCQVNSRLLRTSDGGQTWVEITPQAK